MCSLEIRNADSLTVKTEVYEDIKWGFPELIIKRRGKARPYNEKDSWVLCKDRVVFGGNVESTADSERSLQGTNWKCWGATNMIGTLQINMH